MANPHRGSVALAADDYEYSLSFSVNALCELEAAIDQPVAKIVAQMQKPEEVRLSTVRLLLWAALRDYHPEIDLLHAGRIASAAGIPACMACIGKAFQVAFPSQEASGGARPPKAKAS